MTWLVTADLHYSLKQLDWVLSVAGQHELVLLVGDHLDIASTVAAPVQIVVLKRYLERIAAKTRLLVCSGNHDLDHRDEHGEKVPRWLASLAPTVTSDSGSVRIGEVLFSSFPWWDGPAARARIAEKLARDAGAERGLWVWLYHSPPAGSPVSREFDRDWGEKELRTWVGEYRPDIVFSGHAHNAPFLPDGNWFDRIGPTIVFNAGREPSEVPAHIVVDRVADKATWYSSAGSATTRLASS